MVGHFLSRNRRREFQLTRILSVVNNPRRHGKALKKEELEKALKQLEPIDDHLGFELKKPSQAKTPSKAGTTTAKTSDFEQGKQYATREVFGDVLAKLGDQNKEIYALDGDVMNSTFTQTFKKAHAERFVECYIAEQNMVSVAAGLSRMVLPSGEIAIRSQPPSNIFSQTSLSVARSMRCNDSMVLTKILLSGTLTAMPFTLEGAPSG